MAIKVSGVNVIDNQRNANVGIITANVLDLNPAVTAFSPTDGASSQSTDVNVVLTFGVAIAKGSSGNITFRSGSASGSVIEQIPVTDSKVTISAAQATINPAANLPTDTNIFVVVDEECFTSSVTGAGGGNTLIDDYNFTTELLSASSFSPSDGATSQDHTTNIAVTFSENIQKGSGNITLRSTSASGTILETIAVSSGAVSVSGAVATINPTSDLPADTDVYVVIPADAFTDTVGGGGNAAINTYNFSTGSRLAVASQSPTDGATNQQASTNIEITFSAAPTANTGNITLRSGSASGSVLQTIDVTSGAVTVSSNTATINPPSDLPPDTDVYVVVDEDAFTGGLGGGNTEINTYNFTTGSRLATSSFSPADGSTDQDASANIEITFDSNIAKGTGDILIRNGSNSGTIIETIDVTSGNVTVSGAVATINPTSNLPAGTEVFIVVPEDAFTGGVGGGNALIDDYSYTTIPFTVTNYSPAANGYHYLDNNFVITFNENVAKGSGDIKVRSLSSSGTVQQTLSVSSSNVTVSGTTVTIDFPNNLYVNNLAVSETTYLEIPANAFTNTAGSAGNSAIMHPFICYRLTRQNTSSPNNGATNISRTLRYLSYVFDNPLQGSTGTIEVKDVTNNNTIVNLTGQSSEVSYSGSTITMDMNSYLDWPMGATIRIRFYEDAFQSTYNNNPNPNIYSYFTTVSILGNAMCGGYLICAANNIYWIVAPDSAEVLRQWPSRSHAVSRAQAVSGVSGWFIPTGPQGQNPGYRCRQYWQDQTIPYWSDSSPQNVIRNHGNMGGFSPHYGREFHARAFRCVSY